MTSLHFFSPVASLFWPSKPFTALLPLIFRHFISCSCLWSLALLERHPLLLNVSCSVRRLCPFILAAPVLRTVSPQTDSTETCFPSSNSALHCTFSKRPLAMWMWALSPSGAEPEHPLPYSCDRPLNQGWGPQRPKPGHPNYPTRSCCFSSFSVLEAYPWVDPGDPRSYPAPEGGVTPSPNVFTWENGAERARPERVALYKAIGKTKKEWIKLPGRETLWLTHLSCTAWTG